MPRSFPFLRQPPFPYFSEEAEYRFPRPESADENGLVCMGGNLSPGMLLSGYRQGLFPWFSDGEPLLWWSPDPRFVLFPEELHVADTMRKLMRKRRFELSLDRDFPAVIRACASAKRPKQRGTWITREMIEGYDELRELGLAHSAEARLDGELVGGLYGVGIGQMFFGESMFSLADGASKAAFIALVWRLRDEGFTLIDSQVYTDHLAGLGAREISRFEYLNLLAKRIDGPTRRGDWGQLFAGFPDSKLYRSVVLKASD